MAYEDVLVALADPTRRRLLESLRAGDRTVGELAKAARISQPAASQHLTVLRQARLVNCRPVGTARHYRVSADGLAELQRYIETFWLSVLNAFAASDPAGGADSAPHARLAPMPSTRRATSRRRKP